MYFLGDFAMLPELTCREFLDVEISLAVVESSPGDSISYSLAATPFLNSAKCYLALIFGYKEFLG
jgi:hypothetical protein